MRITFILKESNQTNKKKTFAFQAIRERVGLCTHSKYSNTRKGKSKWSRISWKKKDINCFFMDWKILIDKWVRGSNFYSQVSEIGFIYAMYCTLYAAGSKMRACTHAQLCPTLCYPMDCSPWGSSVHGTLQARLLEWVAISSSRGSSWPRDGSGISCVSCIVGEFFAAEPPGKPHSKRTVCIVVVAQGYPTLCDPMDCSPQGSSLHGILQARILQ